MGAAAIDRLHDDYLAHLVRFAPVQAALLGDPRGLGRLNTVQLAGGESYRAELASLAVLERRRGAIRPRGKLEPLLLAVLGSRFAERRIGPAWRATHARADRTLDLIAEAVHLVLGWGALPAAQRRTHLANLFAQVGPALDASLDRLTCAGTHRLLIGLARDATHDLAALVRDATRAHPHASLTAPAAQALAALRAHRTALGRGGGRPFRAGAGPLRRWLLEVEGIRTPLPRLARQAQAELTRSRHALAAAVTRMAGRHASVRALRALERDHPPATGLLAAARACVRELRGFVAERGLVTLREPSACRIERAPDYLAGLTLACLDVPGPLQPRAGGATYYLQAPGPESSAREAQAIARSFPNVRIAWITAHETYPGHLVQHQHLARAPHPILQVGDSETFIEGWAHYAEGLLVEAGFRDGDPRIAVGVAWARLLRAARLVAALGLHAGSLQPRAAERLFARAALLGPAEARRETLRAIADPTVMTYTIGRLQIEARRRAARARQGSRFDLRRFHDDLLAWGTAPLALR